MAKRGAASYLTDQNWDQEEEQEEAGEFTQAPEEVIKKREIRKAKRRGVTTGDTSSSGTGGVFKGFAGFTSAKPAAAAPAFGSFGTASNGQKEGMKLGGLFGSSAPSSGTTSTTTTTTDTSKPASGQEESKTVVNGTGSKSKSKYLAQLKALNESVTKWIKEHVDKNPYIILSPIFTDYSKHLAEIEKKYPIEWKDGAQPEKKDDATSKDSSPDAAKTESANKEESPAAPAPTFSFQSGLAATTSTSTEASKPTSIFSGSGATGGFTFGGGKTDSTSTPSSGSGFAFGSGSSGTGIFGGSTGSSAFGGAGGGFSFASSKPSDAPAKSEEAAAEEYVPPKNEVTEVKEDGAFYTKRCKLYFKKGDSWQEKGIGNLHLKPCSGKTQLIIRADTNLGNILLNIMLSSSVPMGRQGKNNVSLMCVPNPPIDEKNPDDKTPVSMLIRVKTGEDADELLSKMKDPTAS